MKKFTQLNGLVAPLDRANVDTDVAVHLSALPATLVPVRTISDAADAPLPVPFSEWFDLRRQRPRQWALVKYLLAHPGRIGPFTAFVRGLAPARRTLAEFLLQCLADFPTDG